MFWVKSWIRNGPPVAPGISKGVASTLSAAKIRLAKPIL
jgi:hypothetical protein